MQPTTFQYQNLRGRSFKGQDLSGQDFSGADIRGANFTNATLVGANFSQTKAGLRRRVAIALVALALFLAILSGFMSGYGAGVIASLIALGNKLNPHSFPSGVVALTLLGVFTAITFRKGLASAGGTAVSIAVIAALFAAIASQEVAVVALVQTIGIVSAVAGVMVGALAVALMLVMIATRALVIMAILAVLSAAVGTQFGIAGIESDQIFVIACVVAGAIALVMLCLSGYTGWRAWKGSRRYTLLRSLAVAISTQGTMFRGANLTNTDFTGAILKNTDFRGATLTRTCWFQAKQLEQGRLEDTYLDDAAIRQLVVTKDGREQNFDYCNLRGVNLQDANLIDISLIGADLSEANLQNADLSRAKLVQTQLYRANLTDTCLTGAYIQDWGISTDTCMEEVKCEYIYMQLPTKDDPDPCRKPDNRQETFKDGDFSDFMAPILKTLGLYRQQNVDPRAIAHTFKTLDLYHHQGIDPAAAAIALKQLSQQYPEAGLEVVALEGRGREKIRLQAVVTDAVDRSQLSARYFATYDEIKELSYRDIQTLLTEIAQKDERIRSLEQMVKTAIDSNKFYVETYYNLGDTVSEKSSINIEGSTVSGLVQGNITDVSGVVNLGAISGDVTNAIGQLPSSDEPDQPGLKELLTQLQGAIEAETQLSQEDKAEALEQLKVLAEAGQKPQDAPLKKMANTAVKVLKGTIASLSEATNLVEICGKLLPIITKVLGLP
ncbi:MULTISPECIES: pentapeptide repeat-containing protein [Nostoc]|uniref:Pentapeptide repeat-containing protein n=2 Tax=Nostoc TaxID=1177 RepID=A0ABR8I668_9NOSO|nr:MULTISPECIES: pentapeptide repeat-containing protein [Nostoc]MBD2565617.1 pentapeptide repeat-containing protein [Nostoc linckia FACHB-391]MBD2646045.1 pentapeptide repeat-containing protein [Nostoc foliaceum FACHB-393]